MHGRRGTVLLAAVLLVIQLVCWRGTTRLKSAFPRQHTIQLLKRSQEEQGSQSHSATSTLSHASSTTTFLGSHPSTPLTTPCQPLPIADSPQDVCNHIRLHCPPSGHVDYLQFYYCIGLEHPSPTSAPERGSSSLFSNSTDRRKEGVEEEAAKKHQAAPLSAHLTALRVVALICIILWMLFLFSWVGVVASDFFCPNLGTIAARLGLSESTAGVTFLAFGNGSPDVFSTFGAMRTGSGSLAIGELIGAASYIVSVISGSMMLIAPFRVKRYPFLRDVGFFTVAVATMMVFLFDGKLLFYECAGMIGLYLSYATTVIVGSWWQERQRRKQSLMSSIRDEHSNTSIMGRETHMAPDMERRSSNHLVLPPSPSYQQVSPIEYDPDVDPFSMWQQHQQQQTTRGASPSHSPLLTGYDLPTTSSTMSNAALQRFRPVTGARHSLLGALEFRDVVRSLQQEALADRSVEIFQSRDPERFLPHHHQHQHQQHPTNLDPNRQRVQRTSSQRTHRRGRSLLTLNEDSAATVRLHSVGGNEASGKPGLQRSRTTAGLNAGSSASTARQDDQSWSFTRRTQPSSFDATAVAAAVGDPWKEHSASDGCEQTALPPPALSLNDEEDLTRSTQKPRLHVQTASGSSQDRPSSDDEIEEVNEESMQVKGKRRKQDLSTWTGIRRAVSPALKVLFPSLRHMHEKSWLGIAVGIITAPAILVLNLTLPVVDDEGESAALSGEIVGAVKDVGQPLHGKIRLEGADNDIYATTQRHSNDEDDEDGNIITLDLASPVQNPWDASSDNEGEENRRNQLQVASALRQLPRDTSPLLGTKTNQKNVQRRFSPSRFNASPSAGDDEGDDDSTSDTESCDSQESHLSNTQASHLFLVIAQCIFAPPFCVWSISSSADSSHVGFKTSIALLAGIGLALLVFVSVMRYRRQHQGETRPSLGVYLAVGWARVAAGFLVSILYIMTIVDEVVSILQTLGLILGLSDAILGLTVFAMGNSLGDLVANVTIARMGHPVMAISACFAGPLLNLLLGIGISGTWLLSGNRMESIPNQPNPHAGTSAFNGEHAYHIDFSPTLTVSGLGLLLILLGTLVAVPLNGFYLNKTIGLTLIITYAVIMTTNVLVEIYVQDRNGLR